MSTNVLVLGGSRHIGYHAAVRFLESGATVTFLLRNTAVFENDTVVQKYISTNKARLVKGDALVRSDVQNVWSTATSDSPVNVVLCTIGFSGSPSFSILKGIQINPPNLVTAALLNLFATMPSSTREISPQIVVVSSTGVNRKSRAAAPIPLRPLYGYLIQKPLEDKLGAERVIHSLGGWDWDPTVPEPTEHILDPNWQAMDGMPKPGTLKNAVIIRPALLHDGECLADKAPGGKAPYRVGEGEVGGWSVSRRDVGHFIYELVTDPAQWAKFNNKQVSIAY
ncbi:hypothetical protein AN958_00729 [Leucoagaricus sp. SymC.cos]|nr:hypothetical protein AN958_00729 [Leucoagaricus sp. SymC.cos]